MRVWSRTSRRMLPRTPSQWGFVRGCLRFVSGHAHSVGLGDGVERLAVHPAAVAQQSGRMRWHRHGQQRTTPGRCHRRCIEGARGRLGPADITEAGDQRQPAEPVQCTGRTTPRPPTHGVQAGGRSWRKSWILPRNSETSHSAPPAGTRAAAASWAVARTRLANSSTRASSSATRDSRFSSSAMAHRAPSRPGPANRAAPRRRDHRTAARPARGVHGREASPCRPPSLRHSGVFVALFRCRRRSRASWWSGRSVSVSSRFLADEGGCDDLDAR